MFWKLLGPKRRAPSGTLAEEINKAFGSFDAFKEKFEAGVWAVSAAAGLAGCPNGKLEIVSTANQDNLLWAKPPPEPKASRCWGASLGARLLLKYQTAALIISKPSERSELERSLKNYDAAKK